MDGCMFIPVHVVDSGTTKYDVTSGSDFIKAIDGVSLFVCNPSHYEYNHRVGPTTQQATYTEYVLYICALLNGR